MNLQELLSTLETTDWSGDITGALAFVNKALPVVEAVVPAVGEATPEINDALKAVNGLATGVTTLLNGAGIDQPTHDALQARLATVTTNLTPTTV